MSVAVVKVTTMTATANSTSQLNPAQEALLRAVEAGRTGEVARLVSALSPAERRGCLPALQELRRKSRDAWDGDIWSRDNLQVKALFVAGAGCNTAASAAAQWIATADVTPHPRTLAELLTVLADREPEWIADVARRLADRRTASWAWCRHAGEEVSPDVLAAATTLPPALHARAAELLGIAELVATPDWRFTWAWPTSSARGPGSGASRRSTRCWCWRPGAISTRPCLGGSSPRRSAWVP